MQGRSFLLCFLIIASAFSGCTTTLNRAISDNDFNKVKTLIEKGNDINEKDEFGRTPIIYAVYVRRNLMLKYLIEKGADLNAVDYRGCSALIYASYYGDIESVNDLINAGANIFIRNNEKYSAYDYAQYYNFTEIANLLKQRGADNLSNYLSK